MPDNLIWRVFKLFLGLPSISRRTKNHKLILWMSSNHDCEKYIHIIFAGHLLCLSCVKSNRAWKEGCRGVRWYAYTPAASVVAKGISQSRSFYMESSKLYEVQGVFNKFTENPCDDKTVCGFYIPPHQIFALNSFTPWTFWHTFFALSNKQLTINKYYDFLFHLDWSSH